MKTPSEAFARVADFFEAYANALETQNTKKMVMYHHLPCTFIDDQSTATFSDASKLEGLFNQGIGFYKQYGIVYTQPMVWNKRQWTERVAEVKLTWTYYGGDNKMLYNCDYYYVLKLDKNNDWKIQMAVSVNEKEKMDEWLQHRNQK